MEHRKRSTTAIATTNTTTTTSIKNSALSLFHEDDEDDGEDDAVDVDIGEVGLLIASRSLSILQSFASPVRCHAVAVRFIRIGYCRGASG